MKLDRAALERYIALEQRIHEEESKNTLKAVTLKEEQHTDIEATVKQKQLAFEQAVRNTCVPTRSLVRPIARSSITMTSRSERVVMLYLNERFLSQAAVHSSELCTCMIRVCSMTCLVTPIVFKNVRKVCVLLALMTVFLSAVAAPRKRKMLMT